MASESVAAEPVAEEPVPEEPVSDAEAPAPEADAPAAAATADADLFEQAVQALDSDESPEGIDTSFKKLTKGDRIEATVIQVDSDRVFVDLGTKAEGIVPLGELTDDPIGHASEHVKVGDKIHVVVLRPEGTEGNPIVSKKRADFEQAWLNIEDAYHEKKTFTATVVDRVKGGLVVDIGVRGFVPATHVGNGKLRNIDKFVGQPLECRIIEIDRDRKKVVLSNRIAEEEKRAHAREHIFDMVKPGEILDGQVRRLTDYGAFVDLGGVDGLLHISEMSWMRIGHPREMFKEGQKIQVMVLRLDKDAGKISLGHRQVLPDPWNLIRENYKAGQKLTVKISRLVQSGAFVKLPEGAEAFLPLSEMSVRRLRRPQEAVEEGQEAEVQIIDLKPDERRMVLSIRAAGGGVAPPPSTPGFVDDELDSRRAGGKRKKKGRSKHDEEELEDFIDGRRSFGGSGGGGITIGERLGMLKGFGGRDDAEDLDIAEELDAGEAAAEEPAEEPSSESERASDTPEEKAPEESGASGDTEASADTEESKSED
jgi:4-hydroxy-3-methylbut-2-enyl diphosphate reductase